MSFTRSTSGRQPGAAGRRGGRERPAGIALLIVLGAVVFALDVYATHRLFTSRYPGANDFYFAWRGSQIYWQEGVSPYSERATLAIEQGIWGSVTSEYGHMVPFAYPFYAVLLMWPLIWLSYAWAQAVWMAVLQFAVVGGTLLCLSLVRWRPPPWLLALTALWSIIFYHSARTILLGQLAGVVFIWMVAALWALRRRRDVAAGVLLALTTVKPQIGVLLLPALVLWAMGQRRWRFLAGLGGSMAVLLGVSLVLLPGWLGEFVRQLGGYTTTTNIGSPIWIITHLYAPVLGKTGEIALTGLVLSFMVVEWHHLPGTPARSDRFLWLVSLTLVVTHLVVPRTATTNYVVMYVPLFWLLRCATERWPRARWAVAVFYLLSAAGMWALFFATVKDTLEQPIMYLPLPLALLAILVLVRLPAVERPVPASAGAG